MKKTIVLLAFLLSLIPCAANAAIGDVCGEIYSTDILATVNGGAIESYNIGGRTAIVVEDLADGFTFSVKYDDDARLLTAYSYGAYAYDTDKQVARGRIGSTVGKIYETDIRVIFNGSELPSYNIGGRTAVCIEDLGEISGSPNEEYGYSKYLCNFKWDEGSRTVSLFTYDPNVTAGSVHRIDCKMRDNVIYASFDAFNNYEPNISQIDLSDETQRYRIMPLYVEANGERFEIGTFYASDETPWTFDIDDEKLSAAVLPLVAETPTYDEATALMNDRFSTVELIFENDDYAVFRASNADVSKVVVLKKSGGIFAYYDSGVDKEVTCTIDEYGMMDYAVYPWAAPHGIITTMHENIDLSKIDFEFK